MQSQEKIAAWAAMVQPGSPSPPSPFFLSLTPSPKSSTTIFLQFPLAPQPLKNMASQHQQHGSTSSVFGRLRSLAKSRSKSVSAGAGASTSTKPQKARHAHIPPPPPLANELALMQFIEGGSVESHAKRVMKAQARAAAGSHHNPQNVSVGVVYRDDRGNMWWDEDEQYEYAHLLAGESVDMYAYQGNQGTDAWVKFGKQSPSGKVSPSGRHQQQPRTSPDLERRESISTQESDLMNIVKPVEEGATPIAVPGLSLLSVPMRARKQACRKPEFLVDVAAFGPRSPGPSNSFDVNTTTITSDAARLKGKARRRPAPLKIASSVSSKRPSNPALPSAELPTAERAQREFIENSFRPMPLSRQPVTYTTTIQDVHQEVPKATPTGTMKNLGWRLRAGTTAASTSSLGMGKNPSRLDLRTMFGAGVRNE